VKLIKQTISFLVFHGFFTIAKDAHGDIKKAKKGKMTTNNDFEIDSNLLHVVPALPSIVHQACAKRVYSLMTHKRQNDAKEETLVMLYDIYKSLTLSSLEEGYVVLRYPLDDSQACIIKKLFSQVEMICAQAQNPATPKTTDNKIQAFWNLFMSCGLQLLDSIQRSEATTAVEDLLRCYPEICSKSNSSNEESLVVLTDMLLSILSQPSSALREIVSQVFRAVLPMLNVPALETIVQALKDEEEYEHKHHDSEADEIDEDDKEEEEEEEEEEIVLTTAAQVSEALRNDEHLAELHREDTTLSAIVGKVNDKRKKKQDAKRLRTQLMHFKLRVLDLLQVYVTKCSSQAQVLELILPLFEQLTTTKATSESKVLSERLHAVLNNKLVRAKEVPSSIKAKERAIDILGQVLELLINKPMEKEHVIVGVNVVLYLMRLFANSASDKKTLDNLKTLFDTLVKDSFTKKHSRIPRQIFDDLITRFPQIAFLLLSESLGGVCAEGVAVDDFSRCEAFRMLAALFKLKNLQDAQESCFKKVHESLLLYTLAALNADMKAKRLRTLITFVQSFIKCSLSIKMTGGLENIVSKLEELHFSSPVIKNMVDRILKSLQEVNITKQMTGKKRSMEIEDKNTSEEATATFQTPSKKQKNQSIKVLEKVKETKSRSTIKSSQSH
jgi:DNA polymerase phi